MRWDEITYYSTFIYGSLTVPFMALVKEMVNGNIMLDQMRISIHNSNNDTTISNPSTMCVPLSIQPKISQTQL